MSEEANNAAATAAETGDEAARVRRFFITEGEDESAAFLFARFGKPIAPAIMGLAPASADRVRAAIETAAAEAGVEVVDADPEFGGPNLVAVFCSDWSELTEAPGLDRLIPDLARVAKALSATDARRHRLYNATPEAGLRLAALLVRIDPETDDEPIAAAALANAVQAMLLWSGSAFENENPISLRRNGKAGLRRWHASLLKAAYAAETPLYGTDPALADALVATMARISAEEAAAREAARAAAEPENGEEAEAAAEPQAEASDASEGAVAAPAVEAEQTPEAESAVEPAAEPAEPETIASDAVAPETPAAPPPPVAEEVIEAEGGAADQGEDKGEAGEEPKA